MGFIAAAVVGAGASLYGASQASSAAKGAAAQNQAQFAYNAASQMPFELAGQGALSGLSALSNSGSNGPGGTNYLAMAQGAMPGQMTQAQLEQTPGYQFTLNQGLQATQNSAAARGLGVSGAALKGAAKYATGLADSNYQTQFNNAQQQFSDYGTLNSTQQGNLTNQFNRLNSVAGLGESATSGQGTTGAQLTNQSGNALMTAGNASAAGTVGVGTAATSAANNYLTYNMLQNQ